ncbi:MAG TPA: GGDEF domain-containing protein [Rhizomicrobium sp.]|nr:GGDEF domain-containing protein [Rhizomicrobium sp.]
MKIERIGRAGGALYASGAQAAIAPRPVESPAASSVLGIPESEFTPRVRDALMKMMGEMDALRRELALTRTRLEEVEHTADQDQLLPVLNRRAFVRELSRHIGFSTRYGTPASLVYFDLNDFKNINDTYSHAAGDAVLAHFADTLLSHVRDTDVVGRLGGDEFGVILSHTEVARAHRKAATLADVLATSPAQWNDRTIAVGFSYGAFQLQPGDNADGAMARADEAMYEHKRAAR